MDLLPVLEVIVIEQSDTAHIGISYAVVGQIVFVHLVQVIRICNRSILKPNVDKCIFEIAVFETAIIAETEFHETEITAQMQISRIRPVGEFIKIPEILRSHNVVHHW